MAHISATSGTVLAITGNPITEEPGRGYAIAIKSNITDSSTGNKLLFIYQHMDAGASHLTVGEDVEVGQVLGYAGKSDNTSDGGAWHLHYEVSNHTTSTSSWQGPGSTKYTRVVNRVNPVYFYPAGTFVSGAANNTNNNIVIWDEVKYW